MISGRQLAQTLSDGQAKLLAAAQNIKRLDRSASWPLHLDQKPSR